MKDTAINTFNKAIIELTNAYPNDIRQDKRVIVKDRYGKAKATFTNFKECLDIASNLDSELEFVSAEETSTTYEVTIN